MMVVSAHFSPEIGYQETHLARAFKRLGHDVCVLTSNIVSPLVKGFVDKKRYSAGVGEWEGVIVYRLPAVFSIGNSVFVNPVLMERVVRRERPDLVVCIGISKVFPVFLCPLQRRFGFKMGSIFGDNPHHRKEVGRMWASVRTQLKEFWFRCRLWVYREMMSHGKVLITTKEAEAFLRSLRVIPKGEEVSFLPLGFDSENFFYSREERKNTRMSLGIRDRDIVLGIIGKPHPKKRTLELLHLLEPVLKTEKRLFLWIVGLGKDEYSKRVERFVKRLGDKVRLSFFVPHGKLRGVFSAVDIGVWTQEAITIQEAMGCGVFVIIPKKRTTEHLLAEEDGQFFSSMDAIPGVIMSILEEFPLGDRRRDDLSRKNRRFSYDEIAKRLLKEV